MAVSKVYSGEIVEVWCKLPDEPDKIHMVLVVSDETLQLDGGLFYGVMITTKAYNEDYKLEITSDMLVKPLSKKSYFATHLMGMFTLSEVIKRCNTAIRREYFNDVVNAVIDSIFGEEE